MVKLSTARNPNSGLATYNTWTIRKQRVQKREKAQNFVGTFGSIEPCLFAIARKVWRREILKIRFGFNKRSVDLRNGRLVWELSTMFCYLLNSPGPLLKRQVDRPGAREKIHEADDGMGS